MIHNGYRRMSSDVLNHVPWLISLFQENTFLVCHSKVAVFRCFYLFCFMKTQVKGIQINARSLVGKKKGVKASRGMHSNDRASPA